MKTGGTPGCYISGPHSRDYYLLLDEQSDHILAMRLAAHVREARGISDEHADLPTARLLEIWMDDTPIGAKGARSFYWPGTRSGLPFSTM